MPEVTPTTSTPSASSTEALDEQTLMALALQGVFQQMLKKPEPEDDPDQAQSVAVTNELNKILATTMAQGVMGITGFGL